MGMLRWDAPFVLVQPLSWPVSLTPMILGHCNSQGIPVMASTASAPPTPTPSMPMPPALGVCESVPMIKPPGLTKVSIFDR
jgi:hypothetical protein